MKAPSNSYLAGTGEGDIKVINSELWHACAGPLVSVPPVGSLVVYFPQGHSEHVAATMQKQADSIPRYLNLPSKLICILHNVILHADPETDEVYAQMTLQPVSKYDQEALLLSDMALKQNRQPAEFFCKTLTPSDTSTHGGFSVPRRAAEKIFPPLDFSMQPPAQEIVAKDLHEQTWTFRHIYRGQPKRHLLTTGWSVFVSSKRLFAGDSILFIRDEKSQLLLGIKRANRQQPALSSSVISSDSMHIGLLAAAAQAAANSSPFTIFYNPRACPSEFVIPLAKYNKAMYNQVSLGMRFRMMFETEDSGVRRYMGTITGISDLDPVGWKNSQWHNLKVGWDESATGPRPSRVSMWEIEPVLSPFYICPPPFLRPNFPKQPGFPEDDSDMENILKRMMPYLDDFVVKDASSTIFPGFSLAQWMGMQQNHQVQAALPAFCPPGSSSTSLLNNPSKLNFQSPSLGTSNHKFIEANQQTQLVQSLQPSSVTFPQQPQPQPQQLNQQQSQQQQQQQIQSAHLTNDTTIPNQICGQNLRQPLTSAQLQQQQVHTREAQITQQVTFGISTFQELPHQQVEQTDPLNGPNSLWPSLPEQHLQLQILRKLQQQPQVSSPASPHLDPGVAQHDNSPSQHVQSQQPPLSQKIQIRGHSGFTDGDAPSCSTSSSTRRSALPKDSVVGASNRVEELQCRPEIQVKHEFMGSDVSSLQQNLSLPGFSRQVDVHSRNNVNFVNSIDGLTPDALLSRGFDSGKEMQNLLSNNGGTSQGIEPELSTSAAINSQPFGVPNLSIEARSSADVAMNEGGFMGVGLWSNQTQRMRTYTKVQKRGSVGRTIDVTRYKDYDELRHDLACMFGMEGQLEDSQRTEWKLVYIDHENDILLVGDDPWEEFVSCVQSIKILSAAEVQQMSLDGDLGSVSLLKQASSGTENAWSAL